jgi:hypothetical protein
MMAMDERKQLERITINPEIFGGKPIIRGRRLAPNAITSDADDHAGHANAMARIARRSSIASGSLRLATYAWRMRG